MKDESNQIKQVRFMRLYDHHQDRLERYCMVLSKNREDARDLVSEVILQTYAGLEKLRDENKFPQYLFSIAKKIYLKRNRKKWFFTSVEEPALMITDISPDAARLMDYKILYEALNQLSAKLRQAVVLHELSGFSMKEVAEIEKCSLSAIKVRVMRGRKMLETILTDEPPSLRTPGQNTPIKESQQTINSKAQS